MCPLYNIVPLGTILMACIIVYDIVEVETMITFRRLWTYLEENGISQYYLVNEKGIPSSTLDKLRRNAKLETTTIEKLCDALNCQPGDIMENIPADEVTRKEPSKKKGGRKKKTVSD